MLAQLAVTSTIRSWPDVPLSTHQTWAGAVPAREGPDQVQGIGVARTGPTAG